MPRFYDANTILNNVAVEVNIPQISNPVASTEDAFV